MSRFFVAMFVGATIAAAASTSASAWHCLGPQPQRRIWHGLRRHTGKGAVNFIAPVHTPRRWDWLHNRMVPAVLRVRDYAPHANATHATNPIIRKLHGSLIVRVAPKASVAQGHEQHALSDCLSGWKSGCNPSLTATSQGS
jgi:hypothetical protein